MKTDFNLQVQLTITDEDFLIYKGDNISHVAHLHEIQQQSWFSFLPWKVYFNHIQ